MSDQINLTIDGKAVTVSKGTTVYKAARELGVDIPIFCYQDRMPPFGACRMCLVEVEKMPKLQTSCTLEVTEGMIVKTQSQMALDGRKGIIEFLLINHPLDCPICDRGGECPLQENALHHGAAESRFFEDKRHFPKAKPLGPVLMLDRERCIICARCTRFGEVLAGDHALEFIDRGYRTEVGTPNGGTAESKFIGNTIMICPVGALTSQVYRFRARPWDNEPTPSTCTLCPVGCSFILDSRDGEIMRTRSQENHDVNDIWLCDKGWFGYEFTSHPDRLNAPMIRRSGKLEPATWEEAFTLIASKINEAKSGGKIAGLGGNPLTVEENYLFQKLLRDGAGVNNIDHRVGSPIISIQDEGLSPGMEMTIGETEELSYAILLGLDLTEEFPVIWLRLKQAINKGAKVLFIGNFAPEISTQIENTFLHAPGKELEQIQKYSSAIAKLGEGGKKGAFFVGRQYLSSSHRKAILSELLKLKGTLNNASLNLMEGRGNSFGARWAGMRPDVGPLGQPISKEGLNSLQIIEEGATSGWDVLLVAGADPAAKYPAKLWNDLRSKLGLLVVQDLFLTESARQADVVLPTLSYVEKGGSFINIEGRVQTLLPGKVIPESLHSDAEIFTLIAEKLNVKLTFDTEFLDSLKQERIPYSRLAAIDSQTVADNEQSSIKATFTPILFDHGVRMKHNTHVVQLAKEPKVRLHPNEAQRFDLKNGEKAQFTANGITINAKVKLDDRVSEGTAVFPLGFQQIPVHEFGGNLMNGLAVEIKKFVEIKL